MEWRLSGKNQTFVLPLKVDGEFVVPDASSVFVTVLGNNGQVLDGPRTVEVASTQVEVVTSFETNFLSDASWFSTRFVRVDFRVGDRPHSCNLSYRVHRFIPHTVDGDTVRALVAAEYEELPDSEIDIVAAYFTLLNAQGDKMSQALVSDGVACLSANRAIALQAAIELCPSMPARLRKMEKADTSQYERSAIDFVKLEADLKGKLAGELMQITTSLGGVSFDAQLPTFFVVTNQTDRITGESS